ncbi:MAG TPA: nitrile hydratase subunit beta [Steroidobacteraceae bacterium]
MSYHSYADLGGQDVRGAILQEPEGELFHAAWEPRVMALVVAMGPTGLSNIDMNRAARETLPNYRELSYYEIWLAALEKLLSEKGVLKDALPPPAPLMRADLVAATIARGSRTLRTAPNPARYAVGQAVRTVAAQPAHHTRLPAYARDKSGVVERIHGPHVFPDTNSRGLGESPQWLYTVVFEEQELWGKQTPPQRSVVSVDAFEPYLQPA